MVLATGGLFLARRGLVLATGGLFLARRGIVLATGGFVLAAVAGHGAAGAADSPRR